MHQLWASPPLKCNLAAESDEEAAHMEVPALACQGALRWSPGNEEKLARLVALYADLPREAEKDTHASMEDELQDLLRHCAAATASPLPKC